MRRKMEFSHPGFLAGRVTQAANASEAFCVTMERGMAVFIPQCILSFKENMYW